MAETEATQATEASGNQSLMAAWRAAEAQAGGPEEAPAGLPSEAAAEATEPEAKPAATPAKSKATPAADAIAETGDSAELAQLKSLAEKLKYKLEDGRVTVAERVALREERREAKERIARLESELKAGLEKERGELKPFIDAASAFDLNDLDGFAKALAARKGLDWAGWNDLQKHVMSSLADPNYREVQELKRQARERDEREKREAETRAQVEQNRRVQEARAAYKTTLSQEMAGSQDTLVQAMASDPMFVDVVYRIQEEHYDPSNNSTVTPEEAVELALKATGAKSSFRSELKSLYEKLHAAFGGAPATKAAATPAKTGKTGKATKTEAEVPHVSKPGGVGFMDPSEREYWARQLKASSE